MTSPRWLTAEEISQINALQVEETGEPFLILNHGLLESAVGRPRNRHAYDEERDVVVLSVSLLFGLAKNHAFQQGNKRTATAAALLFLELNGYRWAHPDDEELGKKVLALINGTLDEPALIRWMHDWVIES